VSPDGPAARAPEAVDMERNAESQNPVAPSADESFGVAIFGKMGR
jgi:hypothetical protein